MSYSYVGLIAFFVHIIINFTELTVSRKQNISKPQKVYKYFLFFVLVYYVFDILWGFIYSLKFQLLSFIWTELYFVSVAMAVYFWTKFVVKYIEGKNAFTSILKFSGIIFLVFEFVSLLLNLFLPVMFYFDDLGAYHTSIARTLTMALQTLLFATTAFYMFAVAIKSKGKIRNRHFCVGCFGISMTVFVILSTLYPILPFYSLGYLFGTCFLHTFVLEDEKESRRIELEKLFKLEELHEKELGTMRNIAYTDLLTGVKSKNAYQEEVQIIDEKIKEGLLESFGLVVFDLNDLKRINDIKGHDAGDKYLKSACKIICETFKHSPIFRIGGDEFIAFLIGEDFSNRESLISGFEHLMKENQSNDDIVIAFGYTEFMENQDNNYSSIFNRADLKMYERKKKMKSAI